MSSFCFTQTPKHTSAAEKIVSLSKKKLNEDVQTTNLNKVQVPNSYEGLITPDENTVFVFGSNPEGRHGAGAAKIAREQFGAIYGQGEGLQGNAYALPTKRIKNIPPSKSGQMTFSYGTNKRAEVQSSTTFEAIINGERTATTRYSNGRRRTANRTPTRKRALLPSGAKLRINKGKKNSRRKYHHGEQGTERSPGARHRLPHRGTEGKGQGLRDAGSADGFAGRAGRGAARRAAGRRGRWL